MNIFWTKKTVFLRIEIVKGAYKQHRYEVIMITQNHHGGLSKKVVGNIAGLLIFRCVVADILMEKKIIPNLCRQTDSFAEIEPLVGPSDC